MGLSKDRKIILLTLKYQNYLTYTSVIWTVAISFFVAIISYILISFEMLSENLSLLILLISLLIFIEIAFISIYFWLNNKKDGIEKVILQE